MSEKLKGDTSRQATTAITTVASAKKVSVAPVIMNPLLSAAVTGISLDDFPNKPLLLPPVAISRESKSLVTVGSPTDVDTESLDEINLNTTSEESLLTTSADPNANPVWDANNTSSDSILSQAASSFSALPSVASSVFSTFSKRISEYSGATSRERTPISDNNDNTSTSSAQQLEIQPTYIQQLQQTQPLTSSISAPQLYYQPLQAPSQQPLEQQYQQLQSHQLQQPQPIAVAPPPKAVVPPSTVVAPRPTPYQANVTLNTPQAPSHSPAPLLAPSAPTSETTVNNSLPAPEPPKFYTPTEVSTLPTISAATPPTAGQNTYRLSAKKKIYAPIPGLSDQTSHPIAPAIDPLATAAPIQASLPPTAHQSVPYGYAVASTYDQHHLPPEQQPPPYTKSEERKGGLFSNITNLVPTGVLQNISGLVQSATGTFTQTTKPIESTAPELYSAPSAYQQSQTPFTPSTVNYFGTPTVPPPQNSTGVPSPVLYPSPVANNQIASSSTLVPPSVNTLGSFQQPATAKVVQDSTLTTSSLFTPAVEAGAQLPQPTTILPPPPASGFIAAPPKSGPPDSVNTSTSFFDPTQQPVATPTSFFNPTTLVNAPVSGAVSIPHKSITPETEINTPIQFFDPTTQSATTATPHSFFSPTTPVNIQGLPIPTTTSTLYADQTKVTALGTPSSSSSDNKQTVVLAAAPPSNATKLFQPVASPVATVSSSSPITPSNLLNLNQPGQTNPQSVVQPLLPPTVPTALLSTTVGTPQQPPPPPVAGSAASFRLQKGTRHYKSALTSAEAAPLYGLPATDVTQSQATSQTFFNPFAPPTSVAANITPNTFTQVPNYFIPQATTSQSVSLFAPGQSETEEKKSTVETSSSNPFGSVVSGPQKELNNFAPETPPLLTSNITGATDSRQVDQLTTQPIVETVSAENPIELFEQQTIEAVVPETIELNLTDSESPDSGKQAKFVNLNTEEADSLEKTLQQFSLTEAKPTEFVAAAPLLSPPTTVPPPPQTSSEFNANPYRKGSISAAGADKGTAIPTAALTSTQTTSEPRLANFFADAFGVSSSSVKELNLFTSQQPQQPSNAFVSSPLIQTVPSVAGFFSDTVSAPELIFEPQQQFPALPPQCGITPPSLTTEGQQVAPSGVPATKPVPPPLGFDNLIAQSSTATEVDSNSALLQASLVPGAANVKSAESTVISDTSNVTSDSGIVNTFSNYFNQNSNFATEQQQQQQLQVQQQLKTIAHSSSALFFDTFEPNQLGRDAIFGTAPPAAEVIDNSLSEEQQQEQQLTAAQTNEDQRLQYFFNNPPPKENSAGVGDLNYDLVHSGLSIRNLPTRSLTPISNFVEPPSSVCSEFSELNSSTASAKVPQTETSIKTSPDKTLNVELQAPTENISNTVERASVEKHFEDLPDEILQELRMANVLIGEKAAASAPPTTVTYAPAVKHWFYKRPYGYSKSVWMPFSHFDSALLETTLTMGEGASNIVAVEGGRYDVNIRERTKMPVYWEGTPIEVRRCSWFYKGSDSKYVPYEEMISDLLEAEYKQAVESGEWHQKIMLSMGEYVNFHGPTVMVHFQQQQNTDAWGGTSQKTTRPRVVKRDLDDFTIEQGESQRVDHLLFMVHGIGSACDLKMRSVEEVVDDFRSIAQQLVQSHYKNSTEMSLVGRVEVLPISWHSHLHSEEMGIDEKLRSITLESIPKLRNFTNDTLLDVLFYTSPTFCQKIMNTVATSMNEVYCKYRQRHPDFNGGVSLAGHSLGSLILFDLLCHQNSTKECEDQNMENPDQQFLPPKATTSAGYSNQTNNMNDDDDNVASQHISYTMGPAGTGQPFIHYTQLAFEPKKFFALGSPIGMFVTIRGIDKLGLDFRLPTCSGFYNIFHPFDPVAYRIEALVNPDLSGAPPVLIPHHKGRKRMHLELKETMTRVGADLKQRFLDTFKNTLDTVNFLGVSTKSKTEAEETMKKEVDKVLSMQMQMEQDEQPTLDKSESLHNQVSNMNAGIARERTDSNSTIHSDDIVEVDFPLGKLNDSKRIDYVLQEAPLEFFNEYIFALSSHVCYWESEDTILFVMKEIYSGLGITPDSQVPQQTMTIERPSSRTGATPTLLSPISEKQ